MTEKPASPPEDGDVSLALAQALTRIQELEAECASHAYCDEEEEDPAVLDLLDDLEVLLSEADASRQLDQTFDIEARIRALIQPYRLGPVR